MKKRQWYLLNPVSELWCAISLLLAVIAFLVLALNWGLLVFVVGSFLWWPLGLQSWRIGLQTDDEALSVWYWPGWRRRLRWSDVSAVEVDDQRIRIVAAGGAIRIQQSVQSWPLLLTTAQTRLGQQPAEPAASLSSGEMAAELGLAPDEVINCESRYWRSARIWVGLGTILTTLSFVWSGETAHARLFGILFVGAIVLALWLLVFVAGRGRLVDRVRFSAAGLDMHALDGRWRHFDWSSLVDLSTNSEGGVHLSTTAGNMPLPPRLSNADRLVHAIEQAIAARRRGEALPRMTGEAVPDSALSRAEAEDVSVERGLSVSEGGEG